MRSTVTKPAFPFVTFKCERQGKTFCLPREHIVHTEDFEYIDDFHSRVVDPDRTYVVFKNPNTTKEGTLHAVVDMPVEVFRDQVIRPAWEGNNETSNSLGGRDEHSRM